MEDIKKQFITSCLSTLTKEAKKICEDILVMIGEQDEMLMSKTTLFCDYFLNHKPDGVETTELEKRCKKYIEDVSNFRYYKVTFKRNTQERERILNMRERRLK